VNVRVTRVPWWRSWLSVPPSWAAMGLSRLWQQQDKRTDAYRLLGPIYGWFTEGFETADLQEAKALLETLS
jgi:predicted ATPase